MKVIKIKTPNDLIPPLERGCYPRITRDKVAYLRLDNLTFYIHLLHGDPNIFVIWAGKPRTFSFTTFRYRVFIGSVYDLEREISSIDDVAHFRRNSLIDFDFCASLQNKYPVIDKGNNIKSLINDIEYWQEKGRVVGAAYSIMLANDYYFIHNMHHDSDCFLVWVGHERQFSFARFTPHFITGNAEDVAKFIQDFDNDLPI